MLNSQWVNLADRSSDGLSVSIDCRNAQDNAFHNSTEIRVTVVTASGENFTLYPNPENALDCYHHPFAYAYRALSAGRLDRVPSLTR